MIAATSAAVLAVPLIAFAPQRQFGNADEAKAMLAVHPRQPTFEG
jgi:hypothetical protein